MHQDHEHTDLIKQIQELDIKQNNKVTSILKRQRKERARLIAQLEHKEQATEHNRKFARRPKTIASDIDTHLKKSRDFKTFEDTRGRSLNIGDTVRLLSTASIGKYNDTGRITGFGKKFVTIELLGIKGGEKIASRLSKNLELHNTRS